MQNAPQGEIKDGMQTQPADLNWSHHTGQQDHKQLPSPLTHVVQSSAAYQQNGSEDFQVAGHIWQLPLPPRMQLSLVTVTPAVNPDQGNF